MTDQLPPCLPSSPPPTLLVQPALIPENRRPRVVTLYRVWCALFLVFYVYFGLERILIARGDIEPTFSQLEQYLITEYNQDLRDRWIAEKRADAPGLAVFVLSIALLYLAAAIIPRKPWAWVFGVVVLATTAFPFIITAVAMAPLLVYWVRPEVKRFFGRPV